MSIFDRLKNVAEKTAKDAGAFRRQYNRNEEGNIHFLRSSRKPCRNAGSARGEAGHAVRNGALTVLALCAYAADRSTGTEMLNWLRGPRPLNGQDISFLNDRFRDGKTYLPFTYFAGSTPDNNYTPAQPYKVTIESNHVSAEEQGYMKLFIPCGGADSPRPIKLRQRGSDGKWFLWEQYLLTGVRTPKEADPWA